MPQTNTVHTDAIGGGATEKIKAGGTKILKNGILKLGLGRVQCRVYGTCNTIKT